MNYGSGYNPPPYPGYDPYYQPIKPKGKSILPAVLGGCALFFIIAVVIGVSAWGRFVRWGIGQDLKDYRAIISAAEMPATEKQKLLQEIDRISRRVRDGKGPAFFSWIQHDEIFERAIKDGSVTAEDRKVVKAELDAIEAEQQ